MGDTLRQQLPVTAMDLFRWIDVPTHTDARGSLIVAEQASVPFAIKRVYCIVDTPQGVARGFHAHRRLRQLAVCVSGRCRIVFDDGRARADTWLDSPSQGLLIDAMVWHEMHDFQPETVLMVCASDAYDEADYIRDYDEFRKITAQ